MFIPRIEVGQEDVDKTVYAITLEIAGTMGGASAAYTQHIEFTTMDATAPTPEKNASEAGPLKHRLLYV